MTTFAMVLGSVPLVLATGAGAESRMQIGWVIAGGMTLGTVLTLFVVPCAYSIIGRQHSMRSAEETKPETRHAKPIVKAAE
jgi:multidrug efflux pump